MRKFILALVATLAVISPIALTAAPASANPGSPKCMTKAEWRKIKANDNYGTTRSQVKRITGIWGKVTDSWEDADGYTDMYVEYRQCKRNGKPAAWWKTVFIGYDNYGFDADYYQYPTAMRVSYKGSWYNL